MSKTFTLFFYVKKSKIKADNMAPIYLRITVNGKRSEVSTKRYVEPEKWNPAKGRVRGTTEEVRNINSHLDAIQNKIYEKHNQLLSQNKDITSQAIRNAYLGITEKQQGLLEVFKNEVDKVKELIGKDYAPSTYTKYRTSLKHTSEFIQWKYKVSDIPIKDVDYSFITNMDFYLRTEKNIENNTVVKYLTHLRKVLKIAVANDWLTKNPFLTFKMSSKTVDREFLSEDEVTLLVSKEFQNKRLDQVRDIFAFCCYTGYSFSDVKKLDSSSLVRGIDGELWIHTSRQKTNTKSNIPLLKPALAILEKYEDHPECELKNRLLPVLSNQKMNAYLKEVADLCGIEKNLTMHMARHTFATYALNNGVPMDTVGNVLGHRSIKTTQIYAKVLDKKISYLPRMGSIMRQFCPVLLSKIRD
jgi:site-specific recombinase XerD